MRVCRSSGLTEYERCDVASSHGFGLLLDPALPGCIWVRATTQDYD